MSNDPIKDFNDAKISGLNWNNTVAGAIGAAAKAREEDERRQREQEAQHQELLQQRQASNQEKIKPTSKTESSWLKDFLTFAGFILGFSLLPDILHLPKESLTPWILGGICAVLIRLAVSLLEFVINLLWTLLSLALIGWVVILVAQAILGRFTH